MSAAEATTFAAEGAADYARRGEDLFLQGDSVAALGVLTDGLARAADGGVAARLVLARMAREAGREAEEIEWLESALRADPECPAALLRLSELSLVTGGSAYRERLDAQEPWAPGVREKPSRPALFGAAPTGAPAAPIPQPRSTPRPPPLSVPSFSFPVQDEEEEPENGENSAPHVATVTLAEIYFQQGLKEQAAQIYRQLLERQPGDPAVKRRLDEIEASIAAPG